MRLWSECIFLPECYVKKIYTYVIVYFCSVTNHVFYIIKFLWSLSGLLFWVDYTKSTCQQKSIVRHCRKSSADFASRKMAQTQYHEYWFWSPSAGQVRMSRVRFLTPLTNWGFEVNCFEFVLAFQFCSSCFAFWTKWYIVCYYPQNINKNEETSISLPYCQ